ncbi:MAG: FAD-dependent oxidoreductase [Verrucomicrobia bacterium]|jgi:hypothetical protein|nr:FAD-dependent oxidoreductase [Verrucomicrobiota bacterium]MBT7067970.1 FAD-dependent oxidoreductase [Verrucomicrobiota bacterium]MBT7701688.1 FAD-dependent oxidoreductase [Verrucomicrobiota bacterium]
MKPDTRPHHAVLIEAEAFETFGGWVHDTQFMDQMGSPFLLAHGLGQPVADAVTTVPLPEQGRYRVWVRTRDWTAPWKRESTPESRRAHGTPGAFQLLLNGAALDTTFGTESEAWHWQDGGVVELPGSEVELRLHDLTGFDGRCDAILLTQQLDTPPPDHAPAHWRRALLGLPEAPNDAGSFDLVVAGGGVAGMCAALAAARLGSKVALLQDRPVLGGNASSEVCVNMHGEAGFEPYPRVGDIVKELQPDTEHYWHKGPFEDGSGMDAIRESMLRDEENLSLFLNERVQEVEMEGQRICSLITVNTRSSRQTRFQGGLFADCTGDAAVGHLARADYDMTINGHMGRTNLWFVHDTGSAQEFPSCPWALDLSARPYPPPPEKIDGWYWESGFKHNPIRDGEYIRDWNLRAVFGAWSATKHGKEDYDTWAIKWFAYVSGMRESRRLLGDLVLNETDLHHGIAYEDACVPLTWDMDTHRPEPDYHPGFEGDAFIATADHIKYKRPYWLPYRCLYSRDVPNLFMAGRNISATRMAMGSSRVQRTTGMMGEIVGMATAICRKHSVDPRTVYQKHLDELKAQMSLGCGKGAQ